MTLKKIISGGQTGADIGGLVGARRVGLATGGTAPKGWRTDAGPQPVLASYGLVEHALISYPPRTRRNVLDSDATVLFGRPSTGYTQTKACCERYRKPVLENPTAAELRAWVDAHSFVVLNVAGNRERNNPGLAAYVAALIAEAFSP